MSEKVKVFIFNKFFDVSEGDELHVDDRWEKPGTRFTFKSFMDEPVEAAAFDQDGFGTFFQITKIGYAEEIIEEPIEEVNEEPIEEHPDFNSMTKAELISYIKDNELDIDTVKKNKTTILEELKAYYA